MLGIVHFVLAVACLAVGVAVLTQKKGGQRHRALGYVYAVALVLVNVSALSVYKETGEPGPFHILALVSLLTLSAGIVPAILRRPRGLWVNLHGYFMCWSYVGLLAAGAAQIATKFTLLPGSLAVVAPSIAIVIGGALLIHTRVPRILATLVSSQVRPNQRLQPTRSACG